ncbi:hypothetical protein [Paraburkholderia tuberum]|uniref:Uncharacterized protein n=1 Tax=Paraburkholderia tuberum TaxID=157910 RepID=A0A1H1DTC9_9BURK|nr:hypothetical protein [Paraburkholderia tuberum]SDQ79663.1 hypothetical protein SAMN05445850_1770 [Paraburkholderia tuberum]
MATTTSPPDRNRRANDGDFVDGVKIMAQRLRLLPPFLDGVVTEQAYFRWLARRADAHVRRDRKRFSNGAMGAAYRKAIHEAVLASGGRDDYTGERLDWTLISKYTNAESQVGRHHYKTGFALLPTVDHVDASLSSVSFKICAWRTNDAKNDMPVGVFLNLCERVLRHAGYGVEPPAERAST